MQEVVFERRVGPWRAAGLWLLALSMPASIVAAARWGTQLEATFAPLGEAFGQLTTLGTVVAPILASVATCFVAFRAASRRFGRCVAGPDWLVFDPALRPAWAGRVVALRSEVRDREPTSGAVHVRLQGALPRATPLVVPVSTPAALDAALLELDRRFETEPLAAGRRHGLREGLLTLAQLTLALAGASATAFVLDRRMGEGWAVPAFFGLVAFSAPLALCLAAALTPGTRRVYVGRRGLAVGEELFAWDELTVVGLGEGWVACATGRRTCLAFVGADEGVVHDAIAARLAEAGRPVDEVLGPLPASVAGWRRRVRRLLQAAPAVLVPVGVLAAACVAPNFEVVTHFDTLGQRLYVIHAHDGEGPATVVLVTRPNAGAAALRTAGWWSQTFARGDPSFTVDLDRGRVEGPWLGGSFTPGATFVHVSPDGVVSARPAWRGSVTHRGLRAAAIGRRIVLSPRSVEGVETSFELSAATTLEELAEGTNDATVQGAALGWTTRRCFDVDDAAERLVWGVDRGEVKFVVRAPAGAAWLVFRDGVGYETGFGGRGHQLELAEVAISIDAKGDFTPDPTLPTTHAALLEVRRRVAAGETIAQALTR